MTHQRSVGHCAVCLWEEKGTTLVELLGYLVALGILINVCAVTFVQSARVSQLGETALLRLDTYDAIRSDFTDTVHHALRIEPRLAGFETGDGQVVLLMPASLDAPGDTQFVVFGHRENQPLHRTAYRLSAEGLSLERHQRYPVAFEVVRFSYGPGPAGEPREVTLDLRVYKEREDNRTGGGARVTASLRALGEIVP